MKSPSFPDYISAKTAEFVTFIGDKSGGINIFYDPQHKFYIYQMVGQYTLAQAQESFAATHRHRDKRDSHGNEGCLLDYTESSQLVTGLTTLIPKVSYEKSHGTLMPMYAINPPKIVDFLGSGLSAVAPGVVFHKVKDYSQAIDKHLAEATRQD